MLTVIFKFKRFFRDEEGIATVWSIFWLTICLSIGGLAIDTANAWKVKQILQSTADASSVSAAMEFYFIDDPENPLEGRVKRIANTYAEANMHMARYGDVLPDESIYLGYWNGNTFSPDLGFGTSFPNAVRVVTEQVGGSSLGTFFLRFVGISSFDIRASSVSAYFQAGCDAAAVHSKGNIMIEGNNSFDDFCIYGMKGVDSQAQNYYGPGAMVGMPNLEDCGSGNSFEQHCGPNSPSVSVGFYDALWRFGSHDYDHIPSTFNYKMEASANLFEGVRSSEKLETLADELPGLIDKYLYESMYGSYGDGSEHAETFKEFSQTTYLSTTVVTPILGATRSKGRGKGAISILDVIPNHLEGTIYIVDCRQLKGKLNMGGSNEPTTISKIALIGLDCEYDFDSSIAYDSAFIMTTSDAGLKNNGKASISSSSGATFGNKEGSCEEDKLTLLTQGSMKLAGQLEGSNFDFVAAGAVNFASGGNPTVPTPHVGSSISSAGDVHIAAHHTFNGCGWGMKPIPGNKDFLVSVVQ